MCVLQSSRPQPEYPCSQQDLYTIIETGWQSYAEYLADFMNLSTLYSAATGTDQLTALAAARAMPDEDSRDEVHMTLRVQLKALADTCLIKWSDMSTYIRDGFPEEECDNRRLAAGHRLRNTCSGVGAERQRNSHGSDWLNWYGVYHPKYNCSA